MQDYYDKEVCDKEIVIKRLKCATDNYEKQQARDNMIIKFRDSSISRFGNIHDKLPTEEAKLEFTNLQDEIKYLKEQIEDNPKLAKAYAEITDLKSKISDLTSTATEFQSKTAIEELYRSSMEFIDELKEYIDFNDEERQELNNFAVDELNKKVEILKNELKETEAQTEGYRELLSNYQFEYEQKIEELE